jgi:hypothetical protein
VNLKNKVDDRFDHGTTCFYMNTILTQDDVMVVFFFGMENFHNLAIKRV